MPRPPGSTRRFWPMDEDCLNLNLWTPGLDGAERPVLVWLHGGGYEAGSAIEHIAYDGANMARFGDCVMITVNHRLNILGYFDLSDFGEEYANSANAGTDDIIAALQWVHENIRSFGGLRTVRGRWQGDDAPADAGGGWTVCQGNQYERRAQCAGG